MITVNVHEAKTRFSELTQRMLEGERIIVCKRNVPIMEFTPLKAEKPKPYLGGYSIAMADDFDELPADFMAAFSGEILPTNPPRADY